MKPEPRPLSIQIVPGLPNVTHDSSASGVLRGNFCGEGSYRYGWQDVPRSRATVFAYDCLNVNRTCSSGHTFGREAHPGFPSISTKLKVFHRFALVKTDTANSPAPRGSSDRLCAHLYARGAHGSRRNLWKN
jgi:hypothetical protein